MEIKLILFWTHLFQSIKFTCTGSASIFIGISHLSFPFFDFIIVHNQLFVKHLLITFVYFFKSYQQITGYRRKTDDIRCIYYS